MADPVFGADLGRVEREVGRLAEQAAASADALRAVSRGVSASSVTETSRDGVVRVTVDATGAVANLEISDRSRGLPGAVLASKALTTMRGCSTRRRRSSTTPTATVRARPARWSSSSSTPSAPRCAWR